MTVCALEMLESQVPLIIVGFISVYFWLWEVGFLLDTLKIPDKYLLSVIWTCDWIWVLETSVVDQFRLNEKWEAGQLQKPTNLISLA